MIQVTAKNKYDVHIQTLEGTVVDIINETGSIIVALVEDISSGLAMPYEVIVKEVLQGVRLVKGDD